MCIDVLHVDKVVLGMCANEFDPDDARLVLDLNYKAVFIACNVEHYAVVAADACMPVLGFHVLRGCPAAFECLVMPTLQRAFGISVLRGFPKLFECAFGNNPHGANLSHFGRIVHAVLEMPGP